MSSRCPDAIRLLSSGLALAVWLGAAACREQTRSGSRPPTQAVTRNDSAATQGIPLGVVPQAVFGPMRNPHAGNAAAVATGRQLFTGFNCAGCHSPYAGGGMGPNLRDTLWIYGGSEAQIFSTIAEGRPNGMPAWGGLIPDDQIWMIVSYIKTLSTPEEPVKPPVPSMSEGREAPEPDAPGG